RRSARTPRLGLGWGSPIPWGGKSGRDASSRVGARVRTRRRRATPVRRESCLVRDVWSATSRRNEDSMANGRLAEILQRHRSQVLSDWIREQTADGALRDTRIAEAELRGQCDEFLALLVRATLEAGTNVSSPAFAPVREMLERISRSRGEQGFSPSQTAV